MLEQRAYRFPETTIFSVEGREAKEDSLRESIPLPTQARVRTTPVVHQHEILPVKSKVISINRAPAIPGWTQFPPSGKSILSLKDELPKTSVATKLVQCGRKKSGAETVGRMAGDEEEEEEVEEVVDG